MTAYVKAISKRTEGDDKEKTLPIAHLGSSMVSHGEDFDGNSEYGQCLISELVFNPNSCLNCMTDSRGSVWKDRGTCCPHSRELHYTGDFKLA